MLLEVQHIRKEFQNRTHALADVSFSVGQGEFVSVIGPSGAGKTTLFRILNGAIRCDSGAVLMDGVHFEAAAGRARRAIQRFIGTIYQDFALVENATCRQNVLNACLPDMAFLPAVLGLFGKERIAEADALLAVPLAFLSTSRLMPKPVALVSRTVILVIRSVPFFIYGLIFIRVSGPGPFTGVLTLGVCSVGLLSKRFTEAIEALDFRAYHVLEAMGVPLLLRIRYAVLPQLPPAFASAVLYRFDVNIREASVLGLVGAGGIGAPLIFSMNHYAWNEAGAIALGLILLVWLIDLFSSALRRASA